MSDASVYLPIGAHLLSPEFQQFLIEWNREVSNHYNGWSRSEQEKYKQQFPIRWSGYMAVFQAYVFMNKADVDAVKAYQIEKEDELEWSQKAAHVRRNIIALPLPPLPESPVDTPLPESPDGTPRPTFEDVIASAAVRLAEAEERLALMNEEIAELTELQRVESLHATAMDPIEVVRQDTPTSSRSRSKFYNHPHWPSPVPKLFVQKLKKLYGEREFERQWATAGLPQTTRLIHEDCIFFLFWKTNRLTVQDFLNLTPLLVSHEIFPYDVFSYGTGRSRYW